MLRSIPDMARSSQPLLVDRCVYGQRVAEQPSDYLWKNLCTLLGLKNPSIDKVKEKLGQKISRGTVQRIRDGDGHRSTDVLADIATALGIEVWQLLVPHLADKTPPSLAAQPAASAAPAWPFEAVSYERVRKLGERELGALEDHMLDRLEVIERRRLGEIRPTSDDANRSKTASA